MHKKQQEKELRVMAEEIGDLHYESLYQFLGFLGEKLNKDANKDHDGGRTQLAAKLFEAAELSHQAGDWIHEAWDICKPYMKMETCKDCKYLGAKLYNLGGGDMFDCLRPTNWVKALSATHPTSGGFARSHDSEICDEFEPKEQ